MRYFYRISYRSCSIFRLKFIFNPFINYLFKRPLVALLSRNTLFALFALTVSHSAFGYNFTLADIEFRSWPLKCKAIYLGTAVGKKSLHAQKVPRVVIKKWHDYARNNGGAWHYCAGMVWLSRARSELDEVMQKFYYEKVVDEASFTYGRLPPGNIFKAEVGLTLAMGYKGLRQYNLAQKILEEGIANHPSYPNSYTALSLIYRDVGNGKQVRDVLLKGNEAVGGMSAEIHYFLGLALFALGDASAARHHADEAFKLGYPLRGLEKKLKQMNDKSERSK